jgi:hypothetical protein
MDKVEISNTTPSAKNSEKNDMFIELTVHTGRPSHVAENYCDVGAFH